MDIDQSKPDPLINTVIDKKYRLVARLGEGGFGTVYVANQVRTKERYALKIIKPPVNPRTEALIRGRFMAEAHTLAALRHPNIVEVHDAGVDGELEYMALELLEGSPFDSYLNEKAPFGLEDTLSIVAQICCGLEYAHNRAVIHRDLKPGNLFITPTKNNALHLKILDFGIAKINNPDIAKLHTVSGIGMGSPGYTSPEQAQGMKNVDHRTDLYSLAVITFRMLTLRRPFQPDRRHFDGNAPIAAFVALQLTQDPPDIRSFRPDIPHAWAQLLIQTLDKTPSRRPADAKTFAQVLAAAIPGGIEIVRRVAPLLANQRWLQATNRMPRPKPLVATPTAPTVAEITQEDTSPPVPGVLPGETVTHEASSPVGLRGATTQLTPQTPTRILPIPTPPIQSPASATQSKWPMFLAGLIAVAMLAALLLTLQVGQPSVTTAQVNSAAPILPDAANAEFSQPPVDASPPLVIVVDADPPPDASPPKPPPKRPIVKQKKKTGTLRLSVRPWADVYIDGRRRGKSPYVGPLSVGRHKIRIKRNDKTETFMVTIEENKTTIKRRMLD